MGKNEKTRNGNMSRHNPSLIIWGGTNALRKTILYICTSSIKSEPYTSILNEYLLSTMDVQYTDGYIFQNYNAKPHIANNTNKFFADNNLAGLPCSPDRNKIEYLWE